MITFFMSSPSDVYHLSLLADYSLNRYMSSWDFASTNIVNKCIKSSHEMHLKCSLVYKGARKINTNTIQEIKTFTSLSNSDHFRVTVNVVKLIYSLKDIHPAFWHT